MKWLDLYKFKLMNDYNYFMNKPVLAGTKMIDVINMNTRFIEEFGRLNHRQTIVQKQRNIKIRNSEAQASIIRAAPAAIRSKIQNGVRLYNQLQAEIARGQNVRVNTPRVHHLGISLQRLYTQAITIQREQQRASRSPAPSPPAVLFEISPPLYSVN
ncbi:hypothetical protein OCU04_002166 [Sclerotinia nivalis]|uniref:Uncharacterized protein n=1 Tax=Sclerotinia nivalis TaxID=352851 RepID=A0A9X0AZL4_9HELO|nr:hypothetical protein OCU04_002166 [Sclerotinia nivalis]